MAFLIYTAITSLDGYVSDDAGNFGWAIPDDEVHAFINDLMRPIGAYIYGRRMYDTMAGWETVEARNGPVALATIWKSAQKIVYSTTLSAVSTTKTRLARSFDVSEYGRTKAESSRDLSVGGPQLAAQTFCAGLVDHFHATSG
jgi:dihydrofolate reductase